MSEYVFSPRKGDSEHIAAIKELMRDAWDHNTREDGFRWNRDSHGLLLALGAVQKVDARQGGRAS